MAPELEKSWFELHLYGCGGYPSSWQGWALGWRWRWGGME